MRDGPSAPAKPPLSGDLLLIVEDQSDLRRLAVRQLSSLGLNIVDAVDGVDALQKLEEFGPRVRLVITDWTLPRLGGAELIMRFAREYPDVPVLLCSGHALSPSQVPWDNIKGFLSKPYSKAELIAHVEALWTTSP